MCYYFDDIIQLEHFEFDILTDEKITLNFHDL